MFVVNHSFLFRGKRYKKGQLIPEGHTATRYRTQFLDKVPEEPGEKEVKVKELEVPEAPKSASPSSIPKQPKAVAPQSKPAVN